MSNSASRDLNSQKQEVPCLILRKHTTSQEKEPKGSEFYFVLCVFFVFLIYYTYLLFCRSSPNRAAPPVVRKHTTRQEIEPRGSEFDFVLCIFIFIF